VSDPLKVLKTATEMQKAGIDDSVIDTIVWKNPLRFFAQSGRIDLAELGVDTDIDQRQLFEGNSVLRGQAPVVRPHEPPKT
jgi:hypothetical protein